MTVRAKFTCIGDTPSTIQAPMQNRQGLRQNEAQQLETKEVRTLKLVPVVGDNDPKSENSRFWNATPTGSIELGTVNKDASQQFQIGKSYYVDFTPAE